MNIVIDTSAILAVLLTEPERESLISITRDCDLLAPNSLFWEMGNAISAMFKRDKLNFKQSQVLIRIFEQIPIQYCEINLIKALEIAKELNIYAYDAYMIECARVHRIPLLTLDVSMKEKAMAKKITVMEVQ